MGQDEDPGPFVFDADLFELTVGQPAGPVHLPSLTPPERDQVMGQLREWVTALVHRFAIEARVIPPCWARHNPMVEALSALRDHERASYAESASPAAAVDWFRAYRDIEARLIEIASMTACTTHEHREPTLARFTPADPAGYPS